jgi:DNA ligase (NAD+)
MGPAKREKALGFKVPIISETELMALLPTAEEAPAEDEAPSPPAETGAGQQGSLF